VDLPWERTDRADLLGEAAGLTRPESLARKEYA
jgi:hypothetical protein